MYELRKDILLGRWVAVPSESKSPSEYDLTINSSKVEDSCVLCPGREHESPPEITSLRSPGIFPANTDWLVRALPSFKPIFQIEGDLGRRGVGIYDSMNSRFNPSIVRFGLRSNFLLKNFEIIPP